MSETRVVLPDRAEMIKRLIRVSDDAHLQERFYPILLKSAGRELVPAGIVMMLTLAIHDYTENLPPVIASLLYMKADDFIDALVDNFEVSQQAKGFFKEALDQPS